MRFRTNNLFQNLYILLGILVHSIAEYFNKMCSVLIGPQGQVKKYKQRVMFCMYYPTGLFDMNFL